jgi:hypothetical protein
LVLGYAKPQPNLQLSLTEAYCFIAKRLAI